MPRHDNTTVRELLLSYLVTYIEDHGRPPSFNQMSEAIDRSLPSVRFHVQALHDAGLITYTKSRAKDLVVNTTTTTHTPGSTR